MLDRLTIDDGHHLPKLVINEDASTAAGEARFQATCSCNRMPRHLPGTSGQALSAHAAHINTGIGPSKGPKWLPVGARLAILVVAMLNIWAAAYTTGLFIVHSQAITGSTATIVLCGAHIVGLAVAFSVMVAVRQYIAPTRA